MSADHRHPPFETLTYAALYMSPPPAAFKPHSLITWTVLHLRSCLDSPPRRLEHLDERKEDIAPDQNICAFSAISRNYLFLPAHPIGHTLVHMTNDPPPNPHFCHPQVWSSGATPATKQETLHNAQLSSRRCINLPPCLRLHHIRHDSKRSVLALETNSNSATVSPSSQSSVGRLAEPA